MNRADSSDGQILVVDDEPVNVKVLTQLLQRAGYSNVSSTTDSSKAIPMIRSIEPDLVMLDLHMPSPDGFELLAQLGELVDPGELLPVMVLTADATDATKDRALALGAHDFLAKPFHFPELLLRTRNLLRLRLQNSELNRHRAVLAAQIEEHERAEQQRREELAAITHRTEAVLGGSGLSIVYQPIVDLESLSVVGVEALSRFELEPSRSPDRWFVEAAEIGMGVQLELHALDVAVKGLAELGDMKMSVNLSEAAIRSPALLDLVRSHTPEAIVVELTEHEPIGDYGRLERALEPLRGCGVGLAVDDTGSGFASLSHILRLSPNYIKLDRSLVTGIDRDPARRALAAALCHFGNETSAKIIAEGIETARELAELRDLDVHYGQGYYLARPGPLPLPERIPAYG